MITIIIRVITMALIIIIILFNNNQHNNSNNNNNNNSKPSSDSRPDASPAGLPGACGPDTGMANFQTKNL